MAVVLQRGSIEGRFYAMEMLQKMCQNGYDWNLLTRYQAIDLFKSIFELASDEMNKQASTLMLTDFSTIPQWYDYPLWT